MEEGGTPAQRKMEDSSNRMSGRGGRNNHGGRGRGRGGTSRGRGRGRGRGARKPSTPSEAKLPENDVNRKNVVSPPPDHEKKQASGRGKGGRGRGNHRNKNTHQGNDKTSTQETKGKRAVDRPQSQQAKTGEGKTSQQRHDKKASGSKESKGNDYPEYWDLQECLKRYNDKDPLLIRGVLRVLPSANAMSFCTCDRGSQRRDVILESSRERNRGLNGDTVFVELLPEDDTGEAGDIPVEQAIQEPPSSEEIKETWWQDDPVQVSLWDPTVPIQRNGAIPKGAIDAKDQQQRRGRVVYIVPPKAFGSEINPDQKTPTSFRRIVGTLKRLQRGTTLLTPSNKCLPQFRLSDKQAQTFEDKPADAIFTARYAYGSWKAHFKWPPCTDVTQLGMSANVEDETQTLLIENDVDHGEFSPAVLQECQDVVASGEYTTGTESGWKPTPDMYIGRRDYRKQRIFTIDPTTAKDLDDALHITELENGQIEVGVHIADVSYFVQPETNIDFEAQNRCTTVYLVDRTLPMLPRPLCEIACSLNENVERLAFSCVWRMNRDGSVVKGHKVWYGRTVIKSCARLDYSTAQNIIDGKVANGENETDETLWPTSRRPTSGHTIEQVAADVRLMHEVAMARRRLRFRNGAIALSAVKLTFQLDSDGETPLLCQPYPIRDSNRLVEEYMLLANYLVAQRLITHSGGRALLRNHEPPIYAGLEKVVDVAKATIGFVIDIDSSEALQRSLNRLGLQCQDELVLQCITEMLKMPMKAATYIAAGQVNDEEWSHFALNIPYYTHFTSPIRRYADVIVHRLLQATLDGPEAVSDFPLSEQAIGSICERCNEKKDGSRLAQERSDVVFLALYLKRKPLASQMGVVLSVGKKTFNVFIPSLGVSTMLFLEEHESWTSSDVVESKNGKRTIHIERATGHKGETWKHLTIKEFVKIRVKCLCKEKPPIGVKLELEGPWEGE